MRVVVQRSKDSKVLVGGKIVGQINFGLVLLVGFSTTDIVDDINYMVKKILGLRIFADEKGVMNKDIREVEGEILSISQFTLLADTKKGNRPSYIHAMKGSESSKLYQLFNEKLQEYVPVQTGIFGADMQVVINNDGPVTICLDSK